MRGVYLGDLTWPEAKAWIDAGRVIVVPIGAAAKEHGYHLPLKTDYMLAEALARGVAEALPVVVAPVIGFGYYPAFRHYPGSQHASRPRPSRRCCEASSQASSRKARAGSR